MAEQGARPPPPGPELEDDSDSDPEDEEPEVELPVVVEPAIRNHFRYQVPDTDMSILFPYEPYDCQISMMNHLVRAAMHSQHCLLESPTGTGKTAAILCSLLAWQDNHLRSRLPLVPFERLDPESGNVNTSPRIIYATRTHSQMKQIVRQLKETAYANTPMTILASRSHTCINPLARNPNQDNQQEVMSVDQMCMRMRGIYVAEGNVAEENNRPLCEFYHGDGEEGFADEFRAERNHEAFDIEDLMEAGNLRRSCPYYALKTMQPEAKLIICTYNYILDSWIRRSTRMDRYLEGSVLVLDEAHNIEGVCRDACSKYISRRKLEHIRLQLDFALINPRIPARKVEPILRLQGLIQDFLNWFMEEQITPINYESTNPFSSVLVKVYTDQIVQKLRNLGVTQDTLGRYWRDYYILDDRHREAGEHHGPQFKVEQTAMHYLRSVLGGFRLIVNNTEGNNDYEEETLVPRDYATILEKELTTEVERERNPGLGMYKHFKLKIVCVNSALAFRAAVAGCRSVVATSGTLSPLDSFSPELGIEFHVQETLDHVIDNTRVFPAIISSLSDGRSSFEFTNRRLEEQPAAEAVAMYGDLGVALLRVCAMVPNGVLVFFPSKNRLIKIVEAWQRSGMLQQLMGTKRIFTEKVLRRDVRNGQQPRRNPVQFPQDIVGANDEVDLNDMMNGYREAARTEGGALLFGVMRGRVSEGVDFRDEEARAVVTVGIPYAPRSDSKIDAKFRFNNRRRADDPTFPDGWSWYTGNAYRAANQALGRCIRHARDWGIVLMIDSRFVNAPGNNLPQWVMNHLRTEDAQSLEEIAPAMQGFINSAANLNRNEEEDENEAN